jgi:cytochrome c biogenesis protein CcdA
MKRLVAVLGTIFVFFMIFWATEIKSDQYEPENEFVVIGIDEAKAFHEEGAAFVDERSIVFFFMPGCQNCIWAKKRLDRMIDEDDVPIIEKSMALKENRRQREIYDSMYGVAEEKRGVVPALFIGEVALVGTQEIKKNFRLSTVYEQGLVPVGETLVGESTDTNLLLRFRKFSPVSVAAAGLLDGVNPCAFAVLVFFLSYLAFTGRERRKLIVIGIVFIAAIFITYLLLGFGIFKFLEILKRFQIIISIIYIVTAAVALVLAFFNITDSIKARGGDTRRLALQLSDRMKRLTHSIIRRHASSKYIVIVAGLTGFLISLFEFGCTGQIYLPTIVYIFDMPGFSYRALMFLILYNTMFIIPLLIILFAVAVFGVKSEIVGRKLASRIPVVKAATGGFFIFLAGYMIYISIHLFA